MKKRGKKLLSYLLTLVLVLGLVPWISLPAEAATSNAAKEVAVNEPSLNVMSANETSLPDHVKRAKDGTLTYSEDGLGTGNFAEEAIEGGTVYRLYNPNSGEHFYTLSVFERDSVVKAGWTDEGVAYDASVKASDSDAVPVYRVYNPNAPADNSSHHYTCNAAEAQNLVSLGWRFEGVGFYVFPADRKNGMTVYREYNKNNGAHNYTTNKEEHDFLMEAGWSDENTAWKVKDVREVGTQKEMEAALATTSLTDLKIATNKKVELSIPEEDYALVDLVVDAPKASITNAGAFRSIDLRSIAANTWTEKGNNNDIVVNNTSPVRIIVDALNKILSSLRFNGNIDGVNTLEIPSGTLKQLIVAAKDPIYVSVFGDAEVGSVAVDYATNVNVVGKDSAAIGAVDMNAAGGELYISLLDDSTAGNITVSKEAYGAEGVTTSLTVSAGDNSAVGTIEMGAAGTKASVEASGNATINKVTVAENAASKGNLITSVSLSAGDGAAVGTFKMEAAGAEFDITASGKSTIGEIDVPESASSPETTVNIKAEDSAKISSVTTSAKDVPVSVTANGDSTVETVKVEGPGQATVDGDSSNTTTVDITGANKDAKAVVKKDSVEVETTPNTDTSSIVTNDSGSTIPTKSTGSDNNETSGSIPPKDGGSEGGSGGSSGGSSGGGSYTPPTTSVAVSKVSLDNETPKVGDTIRAIVSPSTATGVKYEWYTINGGAAPVPISGQTSSTLKITEDMKGAKIKVVVNGANDSTANATTTSVVDDPEIKVTQPATGGKIEAPDTSAVVGKTVTLTAKPDNGYALAAFTVKDKSNNAVEVTMKDATHGTFTMPASSVTVTATFASATAKYTVAYTKTGTHGAVAVTGLTEGAAQAGTEITVTPEANAGYVATAVSYTTEAGTTNVNYDSGFKFNMPAANITAITVTFTEKTYEITFKAGDHAAATPGAMEKQVIAYSQASAVNADIKPTTNGFAAAAGYHFDKWNDGTDVAANANIADKAITAMNDLSGIAFKATATFTAQWAENTYKIVFNANEGAAAEGEMSALDIADVTPTNASSKKLPAGTTVKRTGYTFKGWAAKADETTVAKIYDGGAAVPTDVLTGDSGSEITLFAIWEEVPVATAIYKDSSATAIDANVETALTNLSASVKFADGVLTITDGEKITTYTVKDQYGKAWTAAKAYMVEPGGIAYETALGSSTTELTAGQKVYAIAFGTVENDKFTQYPDNTALAYTIKLTTAAPTDLTSILGLTAGTYGDGTNTSYKVETDNEKKTITLTKGSFTDGKDATIGGGDKLVIENGATLTVSAHLFNYGTLTNNGRITGSGAYAGPIVLRAAYLGPNKCESHNAAITSAIQEFKPSDGGQTPVKNQDDQKVWYAIYSKSKDKYVLVENKVTIGGVTYRWVAQLGTNADSIFYCWANINYFEYYDTEEEAKAAGFEDLAQANAAKLAMNNALSSDGFNLEVNLYESGDPLTEDYDELPEPVSSTAILCKDSTD